MQKKVEVSAHIATPKKRCKKYISIFKKTRISKYGRDIRREG